MANAIRAVATTAAAVRFGLIAILPLRKCVFFDFDRSNANQPEVSRSGRASSTGREGDKIEGCDGGVRHLAG